MKTKVKVSDFVVDWLEKIGTEHVFMISGGGIMHLVDSIGRAKKLKYICSHHEQASAIAAEAYGRLRGLGVCVVTTGPGGTNTLTGVAGAWLDSVPMLVISGQVNVETTIYGAGVKGLRQLGDQELNLVDMVRPITKYAVMVTKPEEVRYHLEKAVYLAKSGRPGPVWVELPLNIQGAYVDPSLLRGFSPSEERRYKQRRAGLERQVSKTIHALRRAKRPVLFVGNGVRAAGAERDLLSLIHSLGIPVLTSFAGYDLVSSSHNLFMGRPGTFGQRGANFIIQNSDFLLSIGSRLNLRIVTYNHRAFAREAYKVIVDVDAAELKKPTLDPDIAVNADAGEFIRAMLKKIGRRPLRLNIADWLDYCRRLNKKYQVVLPKYWREKRYVNSYCFVDRLSHFLKSDDCLVLADGTATTCTYQTLKVKQGQRVIVNSGCAAMGYGFPAAIGAASARPKRRVICLEGDGSLQLNIQELQTMKYHQLPIKLFVYTNDGYLSIKVTQDTYMSGRHVASDAKSGVSCPDIIRVGRAYGLKTFRMRHNGEIDHIIKKVFSTPGPVICEINMDPSQALYPKLRADVKPDGTMLTKPLEDMYPFLDRAEFSENMIVKPWQG